MTAPPYESVTKALAGAVCALVFSLGGALIITQGPVGLIMFGGACLIAVAASNAIVLWLLWHRPIAYPLIVIPLVDWIVLLVLFFALGYGDVGGPDSVEEVSERSSQFHVTVDGEMYRASWCEMVLESGRRVPGPLAIYPVSLQYKVSLEGMRRRAPHFLLTYPNQGNQYPLERTDVVFVKREGAKPEVLASDWDLGVTRNRDHFKAFLASCVEQASR